MMHYLELLVVFIFVLWWFNYNPDTDYCFPKFLVLKIIMVVILAYYMFQILPITTLLITYALLSSCYISSYSRFKNVWSPNELDKNNTYMLGISTKFLDILALIIAFIFIPNRFVQPFFDIMPLVSIVGSIITFIPRHIKCERSNRIARCYGPGANSSVNSSLMSLIAMASLASTLPYHIGIVGYLFGFAAVLRSFGMSGILAIFGGSFVYWMYQYPLYTCYVSLALIPIILLGLYLTRNKLDKPVRPIVLFGKYTHPLFTFSLRDVFWKFTWEEVYLKYKHKWFGIGNGSLIYALPEAQIRKKESTYLYFKNQVLPWLHSSVLQWVIEGGRLGVILLIFSLFELLVLGHLDAFFMGFLVTFFINSLFNFPVQMAVDSFLMVMVIKKLVI